jgi:hypothetical protein
MRKLALTLTAALVVGGCTSESGVVQETLQVGADSSATPSPALSAKAKRTTAFAAMPDRGALLAFERLQQPVRRKAHTYHAVQLSEAHALKAARPGGIIELPTPSGQTLRVTYQRHEESLDGNWTWIGTTLDGMEAVITFGEKAVFGRIAQPNTEALRLTMSGGRAWLVETDSSKLLDGNLLGDEDDTGMLLPPKTVQATLAGKRAKSVATAGEKAGAAETVDVVVGYTNGLVTKYGGVSQATSRLTYLAALTNLAYQNSQITGRVRLVHTLQVNYTDTNSNELALQALTGQTCNPTCSPTTVPAELVPLRTARDQYGGDLVSLVRPFQAPQHQGCGIAWLLGGGGFTIDNTDAPFGYSIVSDGNDDDETDGRNYFCRDETFAHELGHNMGQQHNVEDSGGDSGTHSYSYGYREASSTGFYTIMAYRLPNSSQFAISHFGNPSVTYSGRPTGTATADNARSLNISMPLVALFRNTVVPLLGAANNDVNGNGTSDLLWFNTTTNQFAYWLMSNTTRTSSGAFTVPSNFRIVATPDLDGDGRTDLIWRDLNTSSYYYWRSRGDGQFDTGLIANVGANWQIDRTADLNGDGRHDIIWRNASVAGQYALWFMNGVSTVGQTRVFSVPTTFAIAATGDLDGDGRADILWDSASTRQLYAWRSRNDNGASWDYLSLGGYGTGWQVVETGDINADGRSDIVWQNTGSGLFAHWIMNGATTVSTAVVSIGTTARVVAVGDLNGDGRSDVVTRNGAVFSLHRSQGTTYEAPAGLPGAGVEWDVLR